MSKEITLRSTQEILDFFEANKNLTYEQMNEIVSVFVGNKFCPIVFVSAKKDAEPDNERAKREYLIWFKRYLDDFEKENALIPPPIINAVRKGQELNLNQ